jgi:ABC-type antimicrobial peptide transport system permease subunit
MKAMRGNFKMATRSLRSNKWRSLLTMLGVIVGVAAVVTTVGIGEGTKRQFATQISHFGKDLMLVQPGQRRTHHASDSLISRDLLFGLNSTSGLTMTDWQTVRATAGVKLAVPLGVVPGTVQAGSKPLANSLVLATGADLPAALNQTVKYGDFFDTGESAAHTAVLGPHVAEALFQETVPLGRTFSFRGQDFIVRGIFDEFQGTPLSPTANFNDAIFIPASTATEMTNNAQQYYAILAKPQQGQQVATTTAAINRQLGKAHGNQQDFSVLDPQQALAASSNTLDLLTTLITAVAAVALLVGGVGIMNIMLVSVTERMHEIGLRKAVGATDQQILSQFMLEATVLSVTGGIIGLLVSAVIDGLLWAYTSIRPVLSWHAMLIAFVVSVVVGIVFGTAPAAKAARKDPIDALRHE